MINKKTILQRLRFIKYLYEEGVKESKRPEHLSARSLLTFHDAIELFLHLGTETYDIDATNANFMEYWELLSKKLKKDIFQKESMRRLNKARVNLKHHGILPSKIDIEDYRFSVKNFFIENSSFLFNVDFEQLSLVDLITNQEVKIRLKESYKYLSNNKIEEALDEIALAFSELIYSYESSKKDRYGQSPFFFGQSMTFFSSFFMGYSFSNSRDEKERRLGEFIDNAKESIESMQRATKILSFGIDYKKYVRFKIFTPYVQRTINGKKTIDKVNISKINVKKEDVEFCINFVIESSLILQEFDYTNEDRLLNNR